MAKAFVQLQDKLLALSGEGGGEFVEIRPDLFEVGLTEDDKKVNAAACKKLARVANCILYFTIDLDGDPFKVFVSEHSYSSEYRSLVIIIKPSDFAILFHLGFSTYDFSDYEQVIEIDESGEIFFRLKRSEIETPTDTDNFEDMVVILDGVTDTTSLRNAVWPHLQFKYKDSSYGYGFNIPCVGFSSFGLPFEQLRWVVSDENEVIALHEGPLGEMGLIVAIGDVFSFHIFNNGKIYLSNSEGDKKRNRLLFTTYLGALDIAPINAGSFSVENYFYGVGNTHTILRFTYNYLPGPDSVYYEFEICNEGRFYTYRLHPDGSTEQVISSTE